MSVKWGVDVIYSIRTETGFDIDIHQRLKISKSYGAETPDARTLAPFYSAQACDALPPGLELPATASLQAAKSVRNIVPWGQVMWNWCQLVPCCTQT